MGPADTLVAQARAARSAGDVSGAQSLYRRALAADARLLVANNELAVLCVETGKAHEAAALFLYACELSLWRDPVIRRNLSSVLVHIASGGRGAFQLSERGRRYREAAARPSSHANPDVAISVVIVNQHSGAPLRRCIESVVAQGYQRLQIIVVDTATAATAMSGPRDLPHINHIPAAGESAASAFNRGVAAASGDYIQLLCDVDSLAAGWMASMLNAVERAGQTLGFGRVTFVNERDDEFDRLAGGTVFESACMQSAMDWHETRGFGFIAENPAIAPANLFVARDLFMRLGGFAPLRHQYLWDFFLRAIFVAEPTYVPDAVYRYCVDRVDVPVELLQERLREAVPMLASFVERAFSVKAGNVWAPTYGNWGPLFVSRLLSSPVGDLVPPARLRQLVSELVRPAEA